MSLALSERYCYSTGLAVTVYDDMCPAVVRAGYELAKQQHKAGMSTMSRILDVSSVKHELNTHFSGLIRDYSAARPDRRGESTNAVLGGDAVLGRR